jgi:hypothetical protein
VGHGPSDSGAPVEQASGDNACQLTRFARDSGVYTATSDGHPNRFQLFVERAVRLARPGGRVGLVLPSGLATDRGCAGLRRLLLERCDTEAIVGLENAAAIFPIHRSVRFLAVTTTTAAGTRQMRCRFGVRNAEVLDAIPDAVSDASSNNSRWSCPRVFSGDCPATTWTSRISDHRGTCRSSKG